MKSFVAYTESPIAMFVILGSPADADPYDNRYPDSKYVEDSPRCSGVKYCRWQTDSLCRYECKGGKNFSGADHMGRRCSEIGTERNIANRLLSAESLGWNNYIEL